MGAMNMEKAIEDSIKVTSFVAMLRRLTSLNENKMRKVCFIELLFRLLLCTIPNKAFVILALMLFKE